MEGTQAREIIMQDGWCEGVRGKRGRGGAQQTCQLQPSGSPVISMR